MAHKTFDLEKQRFNLSQIPIEAVQQMLANARHTKAMCAGHNKAERNESLVSYYEQYLSFKGVEVNTELKGTFNGPGST